MDDDRSFIWNDGDDAFCAVEENAVALPAELPADLQGRREAVLACVPNILITSLFHV